MMLTTVSPQSFFLLEAFNLVSANPLAGVNFGMRNNRSEIVSAPLFFQRDASVLFCEEMLDAVRSLTPPQTLVFKPLENIGYPTDLNRRFFLNQYTTEAGIRGMERADSRIFGAAEYYRFGIGQVYGLGKSVIVHNILRNHFPHQLGISVSKSMQGMQVQQKEIVGFTQESRKEDFMELSLSFDRSSILRLFLGSTDIGTGGFDSRRYFDLALQFSARLYLENPHTLEDGFAFLVLGGDEPFSFGPARPVLAMYGLEFGRRGGVHLRDAKGKKIQRSRCRMDGPNFMISSKRTLSPGSDQPAFTIRWNRNGFQVIQKRGVNGPHPMLQVSRLFSAVSDEINEELKRFDRLPEYEKIGTLAEYYAKLRSMETPKG